jgi:hypothetical protein
MFGSLWIWRRSSTGYFEFPYRSKIIDEWIKLGYRFTSETKGFDIVVSGDTLRNADAYGRTLLIFLNHGTGIKNILYRNLAKPRGISIRYSSRGNIELVRYYLVHIWVIVKCI